MRTKLLLLITIMFFCLSLYSQKRPSQSRDTLDYAIVDVKPVFPGGEGSLLQYIGLYTMYPKEAREKEIEGRVFVRFAINKWGEIKSIRVIRSVHPLLDEEAIRVVESMPKWKPAENNGEKVDVWFVLPITFSIF